MTDDAALLAQITQHRWRLEDAVATDRVHTPVGPLLTSREWPLSHAHQFLRAERLAGSAAETAAAADGVLVAAGVTPRHVRTYDDALAAALIPALAAGGYLATREVVMVQRREPTGRPEWRAEVTDWPAVRPLLVEWTSREPYGTDAETVRQLVDRATTTAGVSRLRHLAVSVDGRLVGSCQLIDGLVPGVAQIEEVGTLAEFRGRGLGRHWSWTPPTWPAGTAQTWSSSSRTMADRPSRSTTGWAST